MSIIDKIMLKLGYVKRHKSGEVVCLEVSRKMSSIQLAMATEEQLRSLIQFALRSMYLELLEENPNIFEVMLDEETITIKIKVVNP